MKPLLLAFAMTAAAGAQTGHMDAPVLGMAFDASAGSVRAVTGIPGAATLGAAVEGGSELRTAAVSSNRGYAIAITKNGAAVVIGGAGARGLEGSATATQAVVSARGTAAALIASGGSAQIFTGMPDAPRLARTVALNADFTALALSDDGEVLLTLSRGRRGDAVYAIRESGQETFYRARVVSAIGFVPGTQSALVAVAGAVKIVAADLGEQTVGSETGEEITAVAASDDGSQVFVAESSGRVTLHELRSGAAKSAACACTPKLLAPLRGNGVFRLNEAGDGPVWLLDAGTVEPRIYFVAVGEAGR